MATKSVDVLLKEKRIDEIVNPKIVQASPEMTVESAVKLMQDQKSGYIVIAKNKKVVGIFTEVDVVEKILDKNINWASPVSEFMTSQPPVLNIHETVGEAIDMMGTRRLYHIPLLDEKGELVNVISVRTLIRFLAEFYPTEVYNLPPTPHQIMQTEEGG